MLWKDDDWLGSYYELAMEVSTHADDQRLARTASAVFGSPCIRGPWRDRGRMEGEPEGLNVTQADRVPFGYGSLDVPGLGLVGVVFAVVREASGSDWFDVCVPTGMLERVVRVDHPLSRATNPWMGVVDDALVQVAERVYAQVPFELGIIGEEVSGTASAGTVGLSEMRGSVYLLSPALCARVGAEPLVRPLPSGLIRLGPLPYENSGAS